MRRYLLPAFGALALVLLILAVGTPAGTAAKPFPNVIPLPDDFQPEGVVAGRGPVIYAGSLANGSIYQADLRTGVATELVPASESGPTAVGLAFDVRSNTIFAAGRDTGAAFAYDAATGTFAGAGTYPLTAPGSFVNDAVVTEDAVYFTDSFRPYFYRLPLGAGGALPDAGAATETMLSGDFVFVPGGFNANGIEATPDGAYLIIVHSSRGELYRVEPDSGVALLIDLGGESVPAGDGLLLQDDVLYVVQNRLNQIAVVALNETYTAGTVVDTITNDDLSAPATFRIPTTVAAFGDNLYAVNARFDVQPPTEYDIVKVPRD